MSSSSSSTDRNAKEHSKTSRRNKQRGTTSTPYDEHAILIRNAYKSYGPKRRPNAILLNLNMSIKKGTIYGLLGSSGCGKTTTLSCVVGRKFLDAGDIWVLGGKPGTKGSGVPGKRIGYMPQETALFSEFTIRETMLYFGWIFGMETIDILERLQFLLQFLELPSQYRTIKNLSGGQQRRVSFAAALIHDPELLILDEPTVGVDPLLRESIWSYLVQVTNAGKTTVLITTHYIEECRQAHAIGLMRTGRLLAEESPETLLKMYNSTSLEEVFLKLSRGQNDMDDSEVYLKTSEIKRLEQERRKTPSDLVFSTNDETSNKSSTSDETLDYKRGRENKSSCCSKISCFSDFTTKGKFRALMQKNILRLFRNVGVLLFIFALPVMQVILFCLAIGKDPANLHISIVNEETTDSPCSWEPGCDPRTTFEIGLGCRFLSYVNKSLIKKYYNDKQSARASALSGDTWGVVLISKEFSKSLGKKIFTQGPVDEETLEKAEIKVWLDMSNQQIGFKITNELHFAYQLFAQDLLKDCHQNPKLLESPVKMKEPIYGSENPSFTDFIAPGMILTIVFFLGIALTSSALIVERMEGLLDRSWVAGVTPGEILVTHVITQFVVMIGQTVLVLVFMLIVFGITQNGSIYLIFFLSMLQGMCGMCFGFIISAVCDQERDAIQLAMGSFYPMLLLSGVIWPIEGMPKSLRYFSYTLPLSLATDSLRSILMRGWGLFDNYVYLGFLITSVWIVVFLIATFLLLKAQRG